MTKEQLEALKEYIKAVVSCHGLDDHTPEYEAEMYLEAQFLPEEYTPPEYAYTRTPAQRRADGEPHCPKCYTFGHIHRRNCHYAGSGTLYHTKGK